MIAAIDTTFGRASARQRLFIAWAALGATVQLCLPALHGATGPFGAAALWLWWLPLTALGLDLLLIERRPEMVSRNAAPRRRARRGQALRVQSVRAAGAVPGLSSRATRPPRGLSVTSYSTPSRIGRYAPLPYSVSTNGSQRG